MLTGMETIVILIIGVLMAAYGLITVTEPAWFWTRLMGRRMAFPIEQADPELQPSIFLLGARVLGGVMLIAGLIIAVLAAWAQVPA